MNICKISNICSFANKVKPLSFGENNPFAQFNANTICDLAKQDIMRKYIPYQNTANPKKSHKKTFLFFAGIVLGAAACASARNGGFINKILKNNNIMDIAYKNELVKALQKEGIECSTESLKSIVGPSEFKTLVKKFKPEHFQAGLQVSKDTIPLEEFYKNSIDGNFRVSLHTHSNFSDGSATPQEFIDCALKYAKKVKALNKGDDLPPFTIALTDHDNVDGAKEVIRIIAKDPKKYEDLKFVAGCEHSVKSFIGNHDVTSLAVNPFDENLNKMLSDLKAKRLKTIKTFLDEQPKYEGKKITFEDLAKHEKEINKNKETAGKRTMENQAGIVFVRHAISYYHNLINQPVNHKIMNELGTKDVLPIEEVIKNIKGSGGFASLTHPLKSFWRYIGDDNLLKFKSLGIDGIEANHQYTPAKIQEIAQKSKLSGSPDEIHSELTKKYYDFAIKNNLFVSGGTDCHKKQIFSRQPKITPEFLEEKILK